jgi:hypothetical protein
MDTEREQQAPVDSTVEQDPGSWTGQLRRDRAVLSGKRESMSR